MEPILILLVTSIFHKHHSAIAVQYTWTVRYGKANPDGYFRTIIGIDDGETWHFPGPTIRANKGELVSVLVYNGLPTEATSIHWHGQRQRDTPWMDGVQQITQYPILPTLSFNYAFRAESVGTYWYHSHTGGQYTDGLFGPFIVDDPNDPYKNLPELIVLINEWYHNTVINTFDIFTEHHPTGPVYHPLVDFVSGLFNGKGRYNCSFEELLDNTTCMSNAPYERLIVDHSQTYRFRFISAGSQFTYILSIDQHNLTIVAIDGIYVQPYTVQQLVIEIGQRCDVLVNMNQPPANYWIRAITGRTFKEFNAILQYSTASNTTEPNSTANLANGTILLDSQPLIPINTNTFALHPPTFNKTLVLNITCHEPIIDKCFVNENQFRLPDTPTLLTMFQNQVAHYNSTNIIDLTYGDTVLVIINNFVNISHPIHLHGHDFYVLGSGPTSETDVINFDMQRDSATLNYEYPPYRDTVSVPQQSWLAIGFIADNPGSWLFHCHIAFDLEAGMGVIFNVNNGTIVPPPPDYPVVANYDTKVTNPIQSSSAAIKQMHHELVVFVYTLITIALIIGYL
jgi:FtsP/CotA-like multicopper oxidase with cupredoxin domain